MKHKLRILCNTPVAHLAEIRRLLEELGTVDYSRFGYDALLKKIGGYDILIPSLDIMLDRRMLEAAGRLKAIATPSTGIDHIDCDTARERGIAVLSLRGEYRFLKKVSATAELAFGLLLSVSRRIPFAFDAVRSGVWQSADFRGNELKGKTLGIIGYGRLGEMVSRYGRAFGMKILAYDSYRKVKDTWVRQVALPVLLRRADAISVHVIFNGETRGLLGTREFAVMKRGVFLINTSRGAVIDEQALLAALNDGTVKGAGLDVLADELQERTAENPLIRYARTHDNLIITPHMGGVTHESQAKAFSFIIGKIRIKKWFSGGTFYARKTKQ
ncbi:MAG: NAD(P)-dependent oxidoreductase [Candidatus Omnitrophota bacterium]